MTRDLNQDSVCSEFVQLELIKTNLKSCDVSSCFLIKRKILVFKLILKGPMLRLKIPRICLNEPFVYTDRHFKLRTS